jgi:hypothetical protein
VSGKATRDTEAGDPVQYKANAGLDAKLILSTSMNLDVTLNPDYSQVEVDRQQVNLDRFELFFPEKRKFFLENSDLFANLGTETVRPFFSRRIGLNSPVIAGARLSGQAGENWRVGLMNMQTAVKDLNSADNYSVAVLQRKVLARSNVGVFLTNKQVVATPDDTAYNAYAFNRVAGTEFNFASVDNNWTGKAFYHQSFNPGPDGNRFATAGIIKYSTEQFTAGWSQAYIGGNYLAEMGFVRRTGYHQANPTIGYQFYTHNRRVTNHGPKLEADFYFEPDFSLTDREIDLSYSFTWRDRSVIALGLEESYIRLLEPFDPTNTGGRGDPRGNRNQCHRSIPFLHVHPEVAVHLYAGRTLWRLFRRYPNRPGSRDELPGSTFWQHLPGCLLQPGVDARTLHQCGPDPGRAQAGCDLHGEAVLHHLCAIQQPDRQCECEHEVPVALRPGLRLVHRIYRECLPHRLANQERGLVVKLSYWFN